MTAPSELIPRPRAVELAESLTHADLEQLVRLVQARRRKYARQAQRHPRQGGGHDENAWKAEQLAGLEDRLTTALGYTPEAPHAA